MAKSYLKSHVIVFSCSCEDKIGVTLFLWQLMELDEFNVPTSENSKRKMQDNCLWIEKKQFFDERGDPKPSSIMREEVKVASKGRKTSRTGLCTFGIPQASSRWVHHILSFWSLTALALPLMDIGFHLLSPLQPIFCCLVPVFSYPFLEVWFVTVL